MDDLKEKSDSSQSEYESENPEVVIKKVKKKKKKVAPRKVRIKYVRPKKGNRIAFSLIFTFLILGVSILSAMGIILLAREVLGIDKSASSYSVKVPENATVDDIIKIITVDQEEKKKEPIIKVDYVFRLMVNIKESRMQKNGKTFEFVSGEHTLSPNMSYSDMITELMSYHYKEKQTTRITFPEGINLHEAALLLEEKGVCSSTVFTYYFNNGLEKDYPFIEKIPKATAVDLRFYRMEGYLFPDTYEFYVADDIDELQQEDYEIIIRKFYDNFEEKYTDELAARAEEIGMTMDEVVTLASIVQAEAADISDMGNVASVFRNRLENTYMFPTLGSDPTGKYAEKVIRVLSNPVNESMITAYDTYKSPGLPPGPICNPGIEAITAVLYPNDTNYYYFCANVETKQVWYASTYEEHVANCEQAGIDPSLY